MACGLSVWFISVVRTAGGVSSMTWTSVSASWTRRLSVKERIAAFVAL
jgi:hypothetical protein